MSYPLRRAFRLSACLVLACSWPNLAVRSALAQTCHGVQRAAGSSTEQGARVGVSAASVGFDTSRFAGYYELIGLSWGWARDPVDLDVAWAGYRVVRNGLDSAGLGDAAWGARLRLLEPMAGLRLGAGMGGTLPFGDRKRELGMGHAMLSADAWFDFSSDVASLSGSAAYSRALGSQAHDHHTGPVVAPMSGSELAFDVMASWRVVPELGFTARSLLELPTLSDAASRALGALGVEIPFSGGATSLEFAVPLAGNAFDWRVGSGLRFRL